MDRIREKSVLVHKPRNCFGCLVWLKRYTAAWVQTYTDNGTIYDITLCVNCREIVAQMGSDDEFGEGDLQEQVLQAEAQ